MQTATAPQTSEWEALQRDYRNAWEALTEQVGVWSSLSSDTTENRSDPDERCRQLKQAEDRYRQARDRLADYMLASLKQANSRTAKPGLNVSVQADRATPASKAVVRKSVFSLSLGCC